MTTFWVLSYNKGSKPIFIKSENETAEKPKDALKFHTAGLAREFLDEHPRLFMYQPVEYEFDFENEKEF